MSKQLARLILSGWAKGKGLRDVLEGEFTSEELEARNAQGYNVYYLPNPPSYYTPGKTVEGAQIDTFNFVFVDFDLKSGNYASKDDFIARLGDWLEPTSIVDSGGGIHAYWAVSDLDAMSYLRLNRRLMRLLNTDEAVGQIFQLMRLPGSLNVKIEDNFRPCQALLDNPGIIYSCEQLDAVLPPLSHEDEAHCKQHFEKTYRLKSTTKVEAKIPLKFSQLIASNREAKEIWSGNTEDRSKSDYRLAHIMCAQGFTRDEAMSVLVNSSKALGRAPQHQISYAENILDKVWTYEQAPDKASLDLSSTVREILAKPADVSLGTRLPCWRYIDATQHGFRIGQVLGLVAGSGVGKTAVALNMFMGFVQSNPDYHHFFVPLEQPANEIADRWRIMCGDNTALHDKVHVISNYADDGAFRHLSFDQIRDYILKFQVDRNVKVGCVVIDHIGALNKKGAKGENQDLMNICHSMKAFAVATKTLLVMQSQAPREKAGIGDLELDKDAAYGTVFFESYCDYLITVWQPLKRCYSDPDCPTATAFKFCKIRHKNQGSDTIQEDTRYKLFFDPKTSHLREMTQEEESRFKQFLTKATNMRKSDRKTDILSYESISWTQKDAES